MSILATSVVARARADVGRAFFPTGYCLRHCDIWFGLPGSKGAGAGKYSWATHVWTYGTGKHPGDYNPPLGAPVVFGPSTTRKDGNAPKGDVAISIGGGLIVATDASNALVGIMTIAARAKQTQRPYMGWLDNWLGNPITFPKGTATIKPASTQISSALKAVVKNQQKRLNVWKAATPALVVDGIPGPKFTQATKVFQKAHGLKVDGKIGASTWAKLKANPPKPAAPVNYAKLPVLKEGSTGASVKKLQTKLKITADGKFGPATKAKVKAYQKAHGLTADGVVGASTRKKLGLTS